MASLRPGVALEEAREEMRIVAARLEAQYPVNTGHGVSLLPLKEEVVGGVRGGLHLLGGDRLRVSTTTEVRAL